MNDPLQRRMMLTNPSGVIQLESSGGVGSLSAWGNSTTPQTEQLAANAPISLPRKVPETMRTPPGMRTPASMEAVVSGVKPAPTPSVPGGISTLEGMPAIAGTEGVPSDISTFPELTVPDTEGGADYTQLAQELGIDVGRSNWDPYEYMAIMGPKMMTSGSSTFLGAMGAGMDAANTQMLERDAKKRELDYKLRLKQWEAEQEAKKKTEFKPRKYKEQVGGTTYEYAQVNPEALANIDPYNEKGMQQLFQDPTHVNEDGSPMVFRRHVTATKKESKDRKYQTTFTKLDPATRETYVYTAVDPTMVAATPEFNEEGNQLLFTFDEHLYPSGDRVAYTRKLTSKTAKPKEPGLITFTDNEGDWVEAPHLTHELLSQDPDSYRQFPAVYGNKIFKLRKPVEDTEKTGDEYSTTRTTMYENWANMVASSMENYAPRLPEKSRNALEVASTTISESVLALNALNPEEDQEQIRAIRDTIDAATDSREHILATASERGIWAEMKDADQSNLIRIARFATNRKLEQLPKNEQTDLRREQIFFTEFETVLTNLGLNTPYEKRPEFRLNPSFDKVTQDVVIDHMGDLVGLDLTGSPLNFDWLDTVEGGVTEQGSELFRTLQENPVQFQKFQADVMAQAQRVSDANRTTAKDPKVLQYVRDLIAHSINSLYPSGPGKPPQYKKSDVTQWMPPPPGFDYGDNWKWRFNRNWNGGKGAWGWENVGDTSVEIGYFQPVPDQYRLR